MDPDTCLYYRDKAIRLYDLTCSDPEKAREFFAGFRREIRRDWKRRSQDTASSSTAWAEIARSTCTCDGPAAVVCGCGFLPAGDPVMLGFIE
jgi:hypothetical protein